MNQSLRVQARVLHVEDDPLQARLVRRMLQRTPDSAFEVTHVSCLADAGEVLATDDFDVCLLDLGLPDSRGVDAVSVVRQAAPSLPIVVVTGVEDPWAALAAIKQGAQDFLVKDALHPKSLLRSMLVATRARRLPSDGISSGAILAAMDDGVAVLDVDGNVLYANARGLQLLREHDRLTGKALALPRPKGQAWTRLLDAAGNEVTALVRCKPVVLLGRQATLVTITPTSQRRRSRGPELPRPL